MDVIGKTIKFTLGLTIGAAIGAAAAMLIAPQSGKVTKEEIQERLDKIVEAGKQAQTEREKELLSYWEQQVEAKNA
jgi:gas vesicle protein